MKVRGYDRGVRVMINVVEIAPEKYLQTDAAANFLSMQAAAKKDNITLHPNSCWRPWGLQQKFREQWKRGERRLKPCKPGWSKHHMGLAVDINRSHDDPDGGGPLLGATDKWLVANAAKFGFKRTVPRELWHWEFVGMSKEDH